MHESSLAQSALDLVLATAQDNGAQRVTGVKLAVGDLAQADGETVAFWFGILAEGTAADGATVTIEHVKATARCSVLRTRFRDHSAAMGGPLPRLRRRWSAHRPAATSAWPASTSKTSQARRNKLDDQRHQQIDDTGPAAHSRYERPASGVASHSALRCRDVRRQPDQLARRREDHAHREDGRAARG